jgi:hypothetical protein
MNEMKIMVKNGEKFKVYVLISFKSRLRYLKFRCKHDVHNSNS